MAAKPNGFQRGTVLERASLGNVWFPRPAGPARIPQQKVWINLKPEVLVHSAQMNSVLITSSWKIEVFAKMSNASNRET